jgi:hypothetical protein
MRSSTRVLGPALVAAAIIAAGLSVYAQVSRPYHDGAVWQISFVRVKPGMDAAYMNYLASDWKRNQETAKKEGLILSYKVITTEAHGNSDWNLMLMVEYKDLASMEAGDDKADALVQRVVGDDQKQMQGYRDRLEIREVMATRLSREIILEPKR